MSEILFIIGLILLLLFFIFATVGCRCVIVASDSQFVFGCSLLSDTGLQHAVIEPNRFQSGDYTGNAQNIKVLTPSGYMESE